MDTAIILPQSIIPGHLKQYFEPPTPCSSCFICHLAQVFREIWRVLRDDSTAWVVLGDTYARNPQKGDNIPAKNLLGIPWRVALALQADGWILRQDIAWIKTAPMPESVQDRFTSSWEHVFLFSKSPRYFFDLDAVAEPSNGFNGSSFTSAYDVSTKPGLGQAPRQEHPMRHMRNAWVLGPEPFKNIHQEASHYAPFPTALVERCIKAGSSEAGCCPACHAPYVRQVERITSEHVSSAHGSTFMRGKTHEARAPLAAVGQGQRTTAVHTRGWQPSCACNAGAPRPCVIFDPFVGTGTVPLVARALGRHGVGLDLSANYLHDLARPRLQLDALAAWEGRSNGHAALEDFTDTPLFGGARSETAQ